MRKAILMTAALALIGAAAQAQTASVALNSTTHNTAAGFAGTDNLVAFRGLCVTREATPRFIYQDRNADAAVTADNRNALFQWNGSGAPTRLARQADIIAAISAVSGTDVDGDAIFAVFDMEGDANGNVYAALQTGISGGSTLFREDVVRISPAGAVTVVASSGSAGAENAEGTNSLAYDAANDRLFIHIDNFSSQHGLNAPSGNNGANVRGIHVVNNASTASNVTLSTSTLVISEANLNSVVTAGNGVGGGTGTDSNLFDIAYRPVQNDLIASNANTTADNDDLFLIAPATAGSGVCTSFLDSNVIEAALTNERFFGTSTLGAINDQSVDNSYVCVRESTGDIYLANNTGAVLGSYATDRRSIFYVSADGSVVKNVIAEQSVSQDLTGATTSTMMNGASTNPNDRDLRFIEKTPQENSELYTIGRANSGPEGIIRITGFIQASGPASAGSWEMYL